MARAAATFGTRTTWMERCASSPPRQSTSMFWAWRGAWDFQIFQAQVTNGTGGRYIRDTNDLDGAVRQLAATPEYIYVLGFSPEALKADGSFHSLTVKLASGHKLDVQARKGYWAPDAKELARRQNQPVAAEKGDAPRVDETQTKDIAAAIGITTADVNRPELP